MKSYCRTCNDELIIGVNFTEADVKYGKVNCRKCQNEYSRGLSKKFNHDQKLRRKISTSLSEHRLRGYEVKGSIDDYVKTFTNQCAFCGEPFDLFDKNRYKRGSMDRISNGNIVSPQNVQWLCHKCNLTKQDRSNEEFLEYIEKIYSELKKKSK